MDKFIDGLRELEIGALSKKMFGPEIATAFTFVMLLNTAASEDPILTKTGTYDRYWFVVDSTFEDDGFTIHHYTSFVYYVGMGDIVGTTSSFCDYPSEYYCKFLR